MTIKEALVIAAKYGLTKEIQMEINSGLTPIEALIEWDIL